MGYLAREEHFAEIGLSENDLTIFIELDTLVLDLCRIHVIFLLKLLQDKADLELDHVGVVHDGD